MSTSTSMPSSSPSKDLARSQAQLIHAVSIAVVVLCPIVLALPPRKLDVYSVGLVSCTFVGGNELAREYTGRSILTQIQDTAAGRPKKALPSIANEHSAEQGALSKLVFGEQKGNSGLSGRLSEASFTEDKEKLGSRILEEVQKKKTDEVEWRGGEQIGESIPQKSAWKTERDKKEKEALEEGKGYGDMISEQIWEVWSWGREKAEDLKEEDKKVVEKEKKEREGKQ